VVVLGDSFLEGWGLPEEERLSNRLEAMTGVPYANFAMSHFGPYQALLAYREIASGFDHTAVLLGVVPANDFGDLDFELARNLDTYQHRYRPYLVGNAPDYRHFDYREPAWRRVLRRHSYAYNAVSQLDADGVFEVALPGAPARDPSWFYDYQERQVLLLEHVLRALARDVGDRELTVLLIPTEADLRRHARSGPDPLGARLAALGRREGFRVVDLLSAFAAAGPPFDRYFFPCDYHWSAAGNALAARVLGSAGPRPPEAGAQETLP